jgi:hypothetical protein
MSKRRPTQGIQGSRTANAMLTEGEVRAIRKSLEEGLRPKALAELYLLSVETIRRIGRRESWGWVKEEVPMPDIPDVLPPATEEEHRRAMESQARLLKRLGPKYGPKGTES